MRSYRFLFLALIGGLAATGYVFIFGEAGYLERTQLKRDLTRLETELEALRQERESLDNAYLRYRETLGLERPGAQLAEAESAAPEGESPDARAGFPRATILKFEDPTEEPETSPLPFPLPFQIGEDGNTGLAETRALYLSAMFFLMVFGYYIVSRLERALGRK